MEAKVRTGSGCCHIVGKVKGYLAFTSSCAVCKLLVPVGRGGSKTKPPVGKKHRAALIQSPGRYLLPLCPKPAAQPALQLAEYSSKFVKWDLLFLFWPQCDILYHQKMSGKGPVSKKRWVMFSGQTKEANLQPCKRTSTSEERGTGLYERRCWVMNDSKDKGDCRWNRLYTERITGKQPVFPIICSILQGFTGNYMPCFLKLHGRNCVCSARGSLCVLCCELGQCWLELHNS